MVGKNNRGREEIQFIDINADDQIGPTAGLQNMIKSMTEEKESRVKLVCIRYICFFSNKNLQFQKQILCNYFFC